ncbi:DNA-binding transcriptional LysR family regulator [Azospirillum lipoferum]|uniref:LysR family transcriptional regulator n=1 Tax=Azospirillum lipoferum TaxID=193 RepID=A0A5A9FVN3_AZOLI|nr:MULTISPECIES: LysR substrate-binding domain-containing protein [Azospirillum]KAA0585514.1 LysR family transcriptional regulator [Azospirillum lipoferum]MCP1615422.1 DNA-binding transcriptional LysR family regulator [Azospirillum lipoferum]MDW5532939.1 LysR substrate-binding domain-containing protein [Azospirillum sp. NL1]
MALRSIAPLARTLFIFEAAARTGSFSAAAREFNVTQPSVSRNIAQLEAWMEVRLFLRTPACITLTPEGEEIYRVLRDSLERIDHTVGTVRRRAAKTRITLSFSSSFATQWLVPRLRVFKAAFPDVELRLDLVQGMLGQPPSDVDIATRVVEPDDPRYHIWPFAPEIIMPVCSPAYLAERGPLDADPQRHVFLNLNDEHKAHWNRLLNPCGGLEGDGGWVGKWAGKWDVFSDYSVVLQAAQNGEGIALGWVSVISRALGEGVLVRAGTGEIRTGRWHSLIAPKARPLQPVVPAICDWLVAVMRDDLARIDVALS